MRSGALGSHYFEMEAGAPEQPIFNAKHKIRFP
jgi:hypothetical protein